MLERNDWLGGCIRTAEITEPGFHHDVFSAWHPLWVGGAAHALLGDELAARGLEYLNTDLPTATAFPDGEASFLLRSTDANAAEFDRHAPGDGDAWRELLAGFMPNADLAFGLLGTELWSAKGLALGGKAIRRLGRARRRRVRRQPARRPAATGSATRSRRSGSTACSRRGCCTPASARTRRRPGSWRR